MRFSLLGRLTPVFLLAVVLPGILPSPQGAAQQQVEQTIRIGAWNIEWLGSPSNRHGDGHNVPQSPEDLADYIIASGVDILGLEECNDNDGDKVSRTNTTITKALEVIKQKTGNTWTHRLF